MNIDMLKIDVMHRLDKVNSYLMSHRNYMSDEEFWKYVDKRNRLVIVKEAITVIKDNMSVINQL